MRRGQDKSATDSPLPGHGLLGFRVKGFRVKGFRV